MQPQTCGATCKYFRVTGQVVDATIFLMSRALAGFTEARTPRGPVYDNYVNVADAIEARFGAETAALFARPVVTRDPSGVAKTVSWYTSRRGTSQAWGDLDVDTQAGTRSQVAAMMQNLIAMLDDRQVGDDLRRWVNLPSLADSLHLVGGRPVLINWGLLPETAATSPGDRERLFRAGLGSIAPWAELPPFLENDGAAVRRSAVATAPMAASAGATAPVAAQHVIVEVGNRTWIGPAIACLVAAIVLAVLLIPGILRFPEGGAAITSASESEAAGVLRTRIADLQGALNAGGICQPEALVGTVGPLSVPGPMPGGAVGQTPQYAPDTSLPPYGEVTAPTSIAPSPANVEPPATTDGTTTDASSPTDLVDYLDAATVLVLARSPGGLSTGTGFFVNGTDIVTNHHVVEGGAEFFVASKRLGHPVQATLVAKSASTVPGEADFAVLRTNGPTDARALKLANDVPRASNVMAFGFPAFVMESDSEFQCLLSAGAEANADCLPLGSVTMGVVTAIQRGDTGEQLVLHSATISEGNSGGPLVDYCGRAVGVNTFGRRDVERVQQLNFAQHASGLETFLTANGVSYDLETSGCRLVPAATPSAEAAAPAATDEATTPGDGETPPADAAPAIDAAAPPDAAAAPAEGATTPAEPIEVTPPVEGGATDGSATDGTAPGAASAPVATDAPAAAPANP